MPQEDDLTVIVEPVSSWYQVLQTMQEAHAHLLAIVRTLFDHGLDHGYELAAELVALFLTEAQKLSGQLFPEHLIEGEIPGFLHVPVVPFLRPVVVDERHGPKHLTPSFQK